MNDSKEPRPTTAGAELSVERRFWVRVGGLTLAALLAWLVWQIVAPLWQPLVWAALLGALLAPWNARLAKRLGGRTIVASAITLAVTVLLFVLPLAGIAGAVAAQASQLAGRLEQYVPDGAGGQPLDLSQVPMLARPLAWIGDHTGISLKQIETWLIAGARNVLEALVSSSGAVVLGAVGTIVSFLLMLFVLFFVLRDGPALANKVVGMLPIESRRRTRLWQHLQDVTRAVFMGIGLTALAQGFLVGIGFWIAHLPSPLVFGVIAALFALIPVIGTSIVWGPGALYLATQGAFGHAIFLVVWGVLVVGTADNVLRPLLISGRADVPTLAVFIGVVGGLSAFGFIGLFLGPIVLGLLIALFRYEAEMRSPGGDAGPGAS
ncbi:MAG TPA: AI-2E family transporter [Steroidobacteraceae bacterium]|jgi:predicted PurR-regulated permease PerM|nr:AI-2E family transporter [Steroidobacteraceae bacterium]